MGIYASQLREAWKVVSGGLDCNLVRWDFSRGRSLCTVSVIDEEQRKQSGTYTVNPPLVHSLDVVGRNSSVVCGLGNGSVVVYGMQGKSLVPLCSVCCTWQALPMCVALKCCREKALCHSYQEVIKYEKPVVSKLSEEDSKEEPSGAARRGKRHVNWINCFTKCCERHISGPAVRRVENSQHFSP